MSISDYQSLADGFSDEVVTHSIVEDIELPGVGTFALITLDNGQDHRRPTTLGPNTLVELGKALEAQKERAAAGEIVGLGITGKPHFLAAGADLSNQNLSQGGDTSRRTAELGHEAYSLLHDLGVPTFVFINGVALGGGLEVALNANYRTVSRSAGAIALPEVFLGLLPGWGGMYLLPRLIGPDNAVTVIFDNALANNRTLSGTQAYELGIADALFDGADFLESSLEWAAGVIDGSVTVERENEIASTDDVDDAAWDAALDRAKKIVAKRTQNATPAAQRALELFDAGRGYSLEEAFEAENDALADLVSSPEFAATIYAFMDLVQKRAKRPAGAPDKSLARPITKVGIVGAGLMASQLALLFVRRLTVPVVLTDIDQARVDKGVEWVHTEIDKLLEKGRISQDASNRFKALVSGTVDKSDFADADFVIEAVFEEMSVKQQVFAEVEAVVSEECILATNTSSLLVATMAEDLKHPERVIGFHFFNPVAVLPLVEVVRIPQTDDAVLATAFVLAKDLKKNAVLVQDSTAFVVNRVLGRMFGEITAVFDEGTDAETTDNALAPMGLPMTPFHLLALVGLPVGQHVQESLNAAFGDRFYASENQQKLIDAGRKSLYEEDGTISDETLALMERGDTELTSEQVLERTQDALADEISRMLDEGVVAGPEDIDLCMILGAGWPMHLGGITPYLDRVGASERATGKKFHPDRFADAG